jgi:hypothetical protein
MFSINLSASFLQLVYMHNFCGVIVIYLPDMQISNNLTLYKNLY